MKVFARERYYVPYNELSESDAKALVKRYTYHFFEDKACANCEWVGLRKKEGLLGECETCAAYLGSTILSSRVKVGSKPYLTTPLGDRAGLISFLKSRGYSGTIKSLHPIIPIKPIKFTGKLRDYQEKAVEACIAGRYGVLESSPRTGKCVVGSSLVMTEKGLLPIKDLFRGRKLPKNREYTSNDNVSISTFDGTKYTSGFYSKIVDSTVRIGDSDGYVIRGTPNHKVLTVDKDLSCKWVKLADIKEGMILVHSRKEQWLPTGTPKIKPINAKLHEVVTELPRAMSVELAELLGFWVANGTLNTRGFIGISSYNPKVQKRFVQCLSKCFPQIHYRVESDGVFCNSTFVYRFLQKRIGLTCTTAAGKSIPDILLTGDRKYLDAFLRAYISCDAYVAGAHLDFCTASKKLAYQLQTVISYYGARGRRYFKFARATTGSGIYRKYYLVRVYGEDTCRLLSALSYFYKDISYRWPSKNERDVIPYAADVLTELHYSKRNDGTYICENGELLAIDSSSILHQRFKRKCGFTNVHGHVTKYGLTHLNWGTLKLLDSTIYKRLKALVKEQYFFTTVVDKKVIDKPVRVYDVCVPDGHHFLCNSIVSHNTVMLTAIICRLGVKSLIIASQRDWLVGFYETFVGSPTQQGFTNIDKSRIGFCKKLEDFKKYDVCLATVQTFHSDKGQKLLRLLRDTFELVGIDEVHTSSANKYIQEISLFNCNYKIGLTGTPGRKDGRYPLTEAVVGPVLHKVTTERLRPEIKLVRTGFNNGSKSTVWAYVVKKIESDKTRLKLIADWAIRDVEAGHIIAIPFAQTKPIFELVDLINEKAGKEIAKSFVGTMKKQDRDQLIQDMRNRKYKVIVGTMKLLSVGINIASLSALYDATPSANKYAACQRMSRILTPCESKPQPIIRYFLDDVQVRRSCIAVEFWDVVMKDLKAIISEKDMQAMKTYLSQKDYYRGWQ